MCAGGVGHRWWSLATPLVLVIVWYAHDGAMSAALTAEEWGHFAGLLQRFAENDLDQHDAWRLDTFYGPVYVRLTRERPPDEPASAFRPLEPPAPYRTGRTAQVSDLLDVRSRKDVLRVIREMIADYEQSGAAEWENGTLERFLEAFGGFINDLDGYFANHGKPTPAQPDWALLALLLVAATGYE